MKKVLARLFIQFLDGMVLGQQFTLADFQDYVMEYYPRLCPTNAEVAFLVKNSDKVGRVDKVGRWVSYEVVLI